MLPRSSNPNDGPVTNLAGTRFQKGFKYFQDKRFYTILHDLHIFELIASDQSNCKSKEDRVLFDPAISQDDAHLF